MGVCCCSYFFVLMLSCVKTAVHCSLWCDYKNRKVKAEDQHAMVHHHLCPSGYQRPGYIYWSWVVISVWYSDLSGKRALAFLYIFFELILTRVLRRKTLWFQTFGSGNLLRVGVILQRSIFILLLACFPCWAILLNTELLLLLVRQEPEVARSVHILLFYYFIF